MTQLQEVQVKGQCERLRLGLAPDDKKALDLALAQGLVCHTPSDLYRNYRLTDTGKQLVK